MLRVLPVHALVRIANDSTTIRAIYSSFRLVLVTATLGPIALISLVVCLKSKWLISPKRGYGCEHRVPSDV